MRAIIPAAGVGTRLRPHTYTLPKVLLNVAGKPIIGHIVESLIKSGITELTAIIGYQGEKVSEYLSNNFDIPTKYVVQEKRKGLGHAIGMGLEDTDEPALILLGDTIFDVDFSEILGLEHTAIGVTEVDDPHRFGIVEVEGDTVTRLVEKPDDPPSNLAIAGLYKINSQRRLKAAVDEIVEKDITTKGEYQLTDALQVLIDQGEKIVISPVNQWYDCGKKETLLETNRHLLKTKQNGMEIEGNTIIPPVYIGKNCDIKNSIIGPYATIDNGTVIQHSIVRDAIIGPHAQLLGCNLEYSLIGEGAIVKGNVQHLNVGDHSEIDFG